MSSVHSGFTKVTAFILITLIIGFVFLGILIASLFIPLRISNMKHYLWTEGYLSSFDIFPKKDEINGEVVDYHYHSSTIIVNGGQEVYLEVLYSEDAFKEEIVRLENITHKGTKFNFENSIRKDEGTLFNFTTYIGTYNYDGKYEYACVDNEEQRITYVMLRDMTIEKISFDNKYLPKAYYINNANYSHYQDYNTDPYFFDIYGVEPIENMPDYPNLESLNDSVVINSFNRYSAYKPQRDYSGDGSGVKEKPQLECDYDHCEISCDKITGIMTISSTQLSNSTLDLIISSTIASGEAKIVIVKDDIIVQEVLLGETVKLNISSVEESAVLVKLITFNASDVKITVDRVIVNV